MQHFSFYYRDFLDLKSLFPNAYEFRLLFQDDNVIIEDGVIHLIRPEEFNPQRIHNIVRVYPNKYDYFKIEVNIRCWQDDVYCFREVTKFGWLKRSYLFHLALRGINKIFSISYNTLLYSSENMSYYSKNGSLVKIQDGKAIIIGKMPAIPHPRFYEFVPFGNDAFLRANNKIYVSSQQMKKWNLIYKGKRAIKNSMVWIEEEHSLLFMEYTPGLKLTRHHLYKYYFATGEIKNILTFYSPEEHNNEGKEPYCRHIHVLMRDPYTGDIYVGVGDSDDESAIYRSTDKGNNFSKIGGGNQTWRTLSFFFIEDSIFWNTDSPDPQYLSCIKRSTLRKQNITNDDIIHYPLFNGASWNTFYDKSNDMYIMSANREGMLYDSKNRVYAVKFYNGRPTVYNLFEDEEIGQKGMDKFDQLFVLGKDIFGRYWFYDSRRNYYRQFVLRDYSIN